MPANQNNRPTIEDLLSELKAILDEGKKMPFSAGKVVIDANDAYSVIDEIYDYLPEEIRKAKSVIADAEHIRSSAKHDGEIIVKKAQEKAAELVDQETVVQEANRKAEDIMREAEANRNDLLSAAYNYAEELMDDVEKYMASQLGTVRKVKENLSEKRNNDVQ